MTVFKYSDYPKGSLFVKKAEGALFLKLRKGHFSFISMKTFNKSSALHVCEEPRLLSYYTFLPEEFLHYEV